jgi:hypothetical protein
MKTFTIKQVREYVEGWLGADDDMQSLTIDQIKAMLSNAKACVDDPNDGIGDYVKRQAECSMIRKMENEMGMSLSGIQDFLDRNPIKK